MNLQNRLEKLETAANVNSESCACPGARQIRVIEPDLDRTEAEYQSLLTEALRPETCDRCGKLIENNWIIVIEAVHSDIPNPTAATFDIYTK